jgi:predicted dehydrogenase
MVRVGFVGLGHNAIGHIEAHRNVGLSEVAALCDVNPSRLDAAAERFGGARAYASAEELCAQDDIDAVSIHTGDPFHVEPFVEAVKHGKHVLVEKPVANSIEQLDQMAAAANEVDPKQKLAVGYILRFNPLFEAIHTMCVEGDLGQVYYLEGDYVHNLLYQAHQTDTHTGSNWYLEQERPMVGGGSHPLDLIRWFTRAEVVEVSGYSVGLAFPEMHHDDCQVALFRFDNDTIAKVASIYAPRMEMAPCYNLRIYGTCGTVERDMVALARDDEDVHPKFHSIQCDAVSGHPYEPEVEDWLHAIMDDHPLRCDFLDGANSTAATLAACEAIAEKKTLPVKVYRRA